MDQNMTLILTIITINVITNYNILGINNLNIIKYCKYTTRNSRGVFIAKLAINLIARTLLPEIID